MRLVPLICVLIPGLLTGQVPTSKPVTRAEAALVMLRVDEIIKKLVKNPGTMKFTSLAQPEKPITRSEVIDRFFVLFERAKPGFQIQPSPISVVPSKFAGLTPGARGQAETLAKWGFVAPVGTLVTDSKQEISIENFGDAVGLFLSRLAELTHKPSSKYSPQLMRTPTSEAPKKKG